MLIYGDGVFIVERAAIPVFPQPLDFDIIIGLHAHTLDNLGIGFFIVIFTVVIT